MVLLGGEGKQREREGERVFRGFNPFLTLLLESHTLLLSSD